MTRMLLTLGALLIATYAQAQVMPCASSPTPEATVACERARMGQEAMRDPKNIVTFLRRVAADLNEASVDGGPFGILVKDGGHNCAGYSCDIICAGQGPSQKQWDVLVDAGGRSEPTWAGPLPQIAVRPCEIVAVTDQRPVNPPPTADSITHEDLADDLLELAKMVADLKTHVQALRARVDSAAAESLNAATRALTIVDLLKALPAAGAAPPIVFPDYTGKVFGSPVTLRPVRR